MNIDARDGRRCDITPQDLPNTLWLAIAAAVLVVTLRLERLHWLVA